MAIENLNVEKTTFGIFEMKVRNFQVLFPGFWTKSKFWRIY